MTKEAKEFVTELTFREITGQPVTSDMWAPITHFNVQHIALAQLADAFLIAPATANIIAKAAVGIGDDMLTTTLLATKVPVFFAPAMNSNMYMNPVVQKNIETLKKAGAHIINPASGHLACGTAGPGRLPEPVELVRAVDDFFKENESLRGVKVLVTAAGTVEPIDPVRYIGNRSSGKMGYAIATAAARRGAEVTLVSGRTGLDRPGYMEVVDVVSAGDMYEAVTARAEGMDMIVKAAAVADFRPAVCAEDKIKKTGTEEGAAIALERTEDILAWLGAHKGAEQVLCGFSMETKDMLENSRRKLTKKNLDIIAANNLKEAGAGFRVDTNLLTLIRPEEEKVLPLMTKYEAANVLLDELMRIRKEKQSLR
jgi:phosphopantothenoylcysteine decarboxylase/phosphopantothenate--cysteine ligase